MIRAGQLGNSTVTHLIIQTGKHKGRKLKLRPGEDLVIGRDESCQLRLASTDVSRRHCAIKFDQSQVTVTDLGSRNGTFVDGFLIEKTTVMKPGSKLQVGPLEFVLAGGKPVTKPSPIDDDTSDNDIAAWLTEEGETDTPNLSDSTLLPGTALPPPDPVAELDKHPHARAAAEIIQRYWRDRQAQDHG